VVLEALEAAEAALEARMVQTMTIKTQLKALAAMAKF
jgi:hypothetical protein